MKALTLILVGVTRTTLTMSTYREYLDAFATFYFQVKSVANQSRSAELSAQLKD